MTINLKDLSDALAGFDLYGFKVKGGFKLGAIRPDDDLPIIPELPKEIIVKDTIFTLEEIQYVNPNNKFFNAVYV